MGRPQGLKTPAVTAFLELPAATGALSNMQTLTDFLGRLIAGAIKLVLVLAATVFVVSFLLAALVVVVLVSLWSLITGRKPAPVVMFTRMREQSQRYTRGVWPGATRDEPPGEVVDVQATEVKDRAAGATDDVVDVTVAPSPPRH
jgi:hypothetical protein